MKTKNIKAFFLVFGTYSVVLYTSDILCVRNFAA